MTGRVHASSIALAATTWLTLFALACGAGGGHPCTEIDFADGVSMQWKRSHAAIDFEATRPCARDGGLRIVAVFVDIVPADGSGFAPRINLTVTRDGERLLVFSESRAVVPFRAIPDGTRSLVVSLDGTQGEARGYVGTSPSGTRIAYLRWRTGETTHELSATPRPVFTERDLVTLVRDTVSAR